MTGDNFIAIELQGLGWAGDESKRKQRDKAYLKMISQLEKFLKRRGYVDGGASKTATVAVREKLDQNGFHSIIVKSLLVTKIP